MNENLDEGKFFRVDSKSKYRFLPPAGGTTPCQYYHTTKVKKNRNLNQDSFAEVMKSFDKIFRKQKRIKKIKAILNGGVPVPEVYYMVQAPAGVGKSNFGYNGYGINPGKTDYIFSMDVGSLYPNSTVPYRFSTRFRRYRKLSRITNSLGL